MGLTNVNSMPISRLYNPSLCSETELRKNVTVLAEVMKPELSTQLMLHNY
jgi:hypothetical protein